jgi:hypothetical protein
MTRDNGAVTQLTEAAEKFWNEVERQFHPMLRIEQPVYVLSPGQARKYQLAHIGVPKFRHLAKHPNPNYRFCIVDKSLFEKNYEEWNAMGLLDPNGLEKRYQSNPIPRYIGFSGSWDELVQELGQLIAARMLTDQFAKLWALYLRRNHIMLFLDYFDPYKTAIKTFEKNESSEVERYIYAIWLHSHGFQGKKGEKGSLGTELAHQIDKILQNKNLKAKPPWYFSHYEALLLTKDKEHPIIRTVTDMTPELINEYATDGAFTNADFPELFP